MRKPDPPFPSFTLMMAQFNNDSLRLPSYRESLVVRYHPYPRKPSKSTDLMQTVDCRYEEEPSPSINGGDASSASLDPVDDIALNLDRAMSEEEAGVKRRRSLTSLIIDLALAVRAGYRNSRIGKQQPSFAKND
ncbi:hypothetical protein C8Q79DRAFT_602519 [Trametes meyenii]|nr:hypothetical protein C8Q79DRAFT_602519 [Trametes meyenii]